MLACSFYFQEFDEKLLNSIAKIVAEKLKCFSFSSFLLGVSFPKQLSGDETALLKKEFQFGLVKKLEEKLSAKADFQNPEVQITVDFNSSRIFFHVESVFLYGIYKKFSRNLAQTIFYCPSCRGKGCNQCNFSGNSGRKSVQELIALLCMEEFAAKDNRFHGAGREDVDARMLGNGREFVLELLEPKKRQADLRQLEKKINKRFGKKILVSKLSFCPKKKVAELKEAKHFKVYEAVVACVKKIDKKTLFLLRKRAFSVAQRTPERVSKRRADLERKRKAEIVSIKILSSKKFMLRVKAESGLYVKEFVSGDNGRTTPSISSLLENECKCRQLDVVKILR